MSKISDFVTFHTGDGKMPDGTAAPCFQTALSEIFKGRKESHWCWYITPTNTTSKSFGDRFVLSTEDTIAFIQNKLLLSHYLVFMHVVSNQLERGIDPGTLLMSKTDAIKVYKSAKWFNKFGSHTNSELFNVTNRIITMLDRVAQDYMVDTILESICVRRKSMLFNELKYNKLIATARSC